MAISGAMRVGVIGTGHLGSIHAKVWKEVESATLAGVYDADAARAGKAAHDAKTRAYPSVRALLDEVDAVSIVTPTSTHAAVAAEAIAAGKHVFIEKPVTRTEEEAEALIAAARERKVKLQVGHIERFNPAILALDTVRLAPMFVESHRLAQFNPRANDVSVVLDLMIHDIDIIVSLVGSTVDRVEANGVAVVSENLDIANARLQFANGCVANVTASRISQKKMRKMRLFQKDAYISVDFLEGESEMFRLVDAGEAREGGTKKLGEIETGSRRRTILYQKPKIRKVNPLRYELERFVDAIVNDTTPPVTGEDGLLALNVAHRILAKISEQTITL
jgi:predicted dehydrogenase